MGNFDWRNPDYAAVYAERARRLAWLRSDPQPGTRLGALWTYYRDHPADFINDFGVTLDPRNPERKLPTMVPFILFPKQREWVEWVLANWREQEPGLTEKTRDMGMSWLSVALSCTICIFWEGITIGFGSRKEEYVDKLGQPKSLFYKARAFMDYLPAEFRQGWNRKTDAPHMRISFPHSGSVITGEAGDGIGRGDRASIYFVDEAAFLERPELVEASLSATTNCRQDISSVHGMGNPFAIKRHSGRIRVFTFHWRDDPRKDDAWYAKQCEKLDAVTVAQEIDINYSASVEGVVIPSEWVQAAIGAAQKLGIKPTGAKRASLDVADEGKDGNAFGMAKGIELQQAEEWSGKGSDIFETVVRAFGLADEWGVGEFRFDSDGLGAGVRGDANQINGDRQRRIEVTPWRGSAGVVDPEGEIPQIGEPDPEGPVRTNEDYFQNAKAQGWWSLRLRFQRTYRAVMGIDTRFDPDDLISLAPDLPALNKLCGELSRPTYSKTTAGKIIIDKKPKGTASPNLADMLMIMFAADQGEPEGVGMLLGGRRFGGG